MISAPLLSAEKVSIFMAIRSIRPRKASLTCGGPAPMGRLTGIGLQFSRVADFVERAEEVGPFAVHLVDERDPRHVVLVGLMPDGFALGLDAFAGAEDHHAAVEHAQAPLDLGREIDVAGRVDQVDLDVLPGEGDRRRR